MFQLGGSLSLAWTPPIITPFPHCVASAARGICVHLSLLDFMEEGDGIAWEYVSAVWHTHDSAMRQACREYLCLLLGHAPDKIVFDNWKFWNFCRKHISVERLREAAHWAHRSRKWHGCIDVWWACVVPALRVLASARARPPPPPCLLYTSDAADE